MARGVSIPPPRGPYYRRLPGGRSSSRPFFIGLSLKRPWEGGASRGVRVIVASTLPYPCKILTKDINRQGGL
jgi:hypothetical protein